MSLRAFAVAFTFLIPASAAEQPLPFSHKTHAETAKLKCEECHPSPVKFGAQMGFPPTSKCMSCHILIAKDKPSIQKLAAAAKANQPIPWTRVFVLADFAFFDHRFHLLNGAKCEDCHGSVATRDELTDYLHATKMTFCQACHVKTHAAAGCNTCHNYR